MEQMRSVELRLAAGAVDEVERATLLETRQQAVQWMRGRAAAVEGDRSEWAIAETTREYGEGRILRLREMKAEREEALGLAVAAHQQSRVRMEQMKSVVERAALARMREETRKAQAASDDRYAGQAWMRGKVRRDSSGDEGA